MRAFSLDLRERVVAAVLGGDGQSGQSQAAVAKRFAVSTATVSRYLRQHRERDGDLSPRPISGAARRVPEEKLPELERHLEGNPDASLEEVQAWLAQQGTRVSRATVHRTLRRQGLTWKKSRSKPANVTRPGAPPG